MADEKQEPLHGYDNRSLRGNDLGNNFFRGFDDFNKEGDLYEEPAEEERSEDEEEKSEEDEDAGE